MDNPRPLRGLRGNSLPSVVRQPPPRIASTTRPCAPPPSDSLRSPRTRAPQEARQVAADDSRHLSRLLLPTPRRNKSHIMRSLPAVARRGSPSASPFPASSHNVLFCSSATPARLKALPLVAQRPPWAVAPGLGAGPLVGLRTARAARTCFALQGLGCRRVRLPAPQASCRHSRHAAC